MDQVFTVDPGAVKPQAPTSEAHPLRHYIRLPLTADRPWSPEFMTLWAM